MKYWNDRLKLSKDGDHEGKSVKEPSRYEPPITITHDEVVKQQHANETIEWIKVKDNSGTLHQNYVEDLVEHTADTRNTTIEAAKKMLYLQEEQKAGHKKQGYHMKAKRTGMLSELLIPQPNNVNPTAHMKVKDEKTIETILL